MISKEKILFELRSKAHWYERLARNSTDTLTYVRHADLEDFCKRMIKRIQDGEFNPPNPDSSETPD